MTEEREGEARIEENSRLSVNRAVDVMHDDEENKCISPFFRQMDAG